jgi:hypothetical protein
MANTKISALTASTTPLAGTEVLPIVQSGVTKQVSVANLTSGRDTTIANLVLYNPGFGYFGIRNSALAADFTNNALGQSSDGLSTIVNAKTGGTVKLRINDTSVFEVAADTTLVSGNLIPGTAGRGVNFTANTATAGSTSRLLNWYEEGTWTPAQGGGLTVIGAFSSTGRYTRIGRQVTINATVTGATSVAVTAAGIITTNLPFTVGTAGHGNATNAAVTAFAAVICTTTNVTSAGAIAATGTITFSATYIV